MPLGQRTRAGRVAQGVFLGVLTAYLLVLAFELPGLSRGARLFPSIILLASALFVALKTLSTFHSRAARFLEPDVEPMVPRAGVGEGDAASTLPAAEPPAAPAPPSPGEPSARPPSPIVAWSWVAGAVIAMYAFGFLVGTAVSVFAYMRFVGGDGWRVSAAVAGITALFAYLVFVRAMHIPLDLGLMSRLV